MNVSARPPTAKIYQVPRKSAASPAGAGRDVKIAVDHRLRAVPNVEFGSGWYHDAAIQADWTRKS